MMIMQKPATVVVAAMLALFPGLASAADSACLTKAEASSLVTYALPEAITAAGERCRTTLPANAFLPTQGARLAARYGVQKEKSWPAAKSAFLKLSTSGKDNGQASGFIAQMPDPSLRTIVDAAVEGGVSQAIPLKACGKLDLAVDLLSPLPPENMAGIVTLIVDLVGERATRAGSQSAKTPIPICKS